MYASFVQDKFEYTQQTICMHVLITTYSMESNGYYIAEVPELVIQLARGLGLVIPFSVVLAKCAVYMDLHACMLHL